MSDINNVELQRKALNEPFNIETHKRLFVSYLEVIIKPDGTVEYAVPSHYNKLISIYGESHNMTFDEAYDYFYNLHKVGIFVDVDYLVRETKCVSIWFNGRIGEPNDAQTKTLKELKSAGIYNGRI